MSAAGDPPPAAPSSRRKPCPICGKAVPAGRGYDPFCSKRCADIDLHRWLGGVYAVPSDATGDEAEEHEG